MGTVTSVSGGTMSVTATGGMMNISATLVGKAIIQLDIENSYLYLCNIYNIMTHTLHLHINIFRLNLLNCDCDHIAEIMDNFYEF